jgi:hypothetical protein
MEWTMKTVYLGCSALGGSVLVLQTLLLMLGGGDVDADADVDMDVDADVDAGGGHGSHGGHGGTHDLLSLRAITSFLTFFGLAGWGGTEAGWSTPVTMGVAVGSGLVMLFVVAAMTTLHRRVYSQGNVEPANAVGQNARVYLRIPKKGAGEGKITVSIQGRSLQYAATSSGPELPTGSEVRVLRVTSPNTFEVEPLA